MLVSEIAAEDVPAPAENTVERSTYEFGCLCVRTTSMWPRSASPAMALFAALFEHCRLADSSSQESATVDLPKARSASTPKTRAALSERSRFEQHRSRAHAVRLPVFGSFGVQI